MRFLRKQTTVTGMIVSASLLAGFTLGGCPMMEVGNQTGGGSNGGGNGSGNGDGSGDGSGNGSGGGDNQNDNSGLGAKIFDLELRVDSFDVEQSSPNQVGSSSMLFGTFPVEPLTTMYTVEYTNPNSPPLEFSVSWRPGEPIPRRIFVTAGDLVISGYDEGIAGGEYYVQVSQAGCAGAVGGGCELGGETTLAHEETLRNTGGTARVRVDLGQPLQP